MVAIPKTSPKYIPIEPVEIRPQPAAIPPNADMIMSPFQIRVDNQEKFPWIFSALAADKVQTKGGREAYFIVPTVCDSHLDFGDYAIVGLESYFRAERKSKEDMYGTIAAFHQHNGEERKKKRLDPDYEIAEHWFARQLQGLNSLTGYGHIIIECTFPDFLVQPANTQFRPKSASRTILSWMQDYPLVHWHFPGGRRMSEVLCFRMMQKRYDHLQKVPLSQ